jgi:hypothetical protein
MFPQNEGAIDRILRLVVGIALGGFTFALLTGLGQIILGIVAVILVLTGLVGFCPLYAIFGVNTRGSHRASRA